MSEKQPEIRRLYSIKLGGGVNNESKDNNGLFRV
jgi:hypothetical protein